MAERSCTFCTRPLSLGRAREHVFPDWLLREWKLSDSEVQPTHQSSTGDLISTRRHTLDDLLLGSVCDRCNSGWMSALEIEVRQVLLDLASNRRALVSLSPDEARTLSAWTFKTAISLNYCSNYRRLIAPGQIGFFYARKRLPKDVFVFAHQTTFAGDICWAQDTTWPGTFPSAWPKERVESEMQDLYRRAFKIRFLVGGLALMAASAPIVDYELVADRAIHFPLELGSKVLWSRSAGIEYESEREMIVKFGLHLKVRRKG